MLCVPASELAGSRDPANWDLDTRAHPTSTPAMTLATARPVQKLSRVEPRERMTEPCEVCVLFRKLACHSRGRRLGSSVEAGGGWLDVEVWDARNGESVQPRNRAALQHCATSSFRHACRRRRSCSDASCRGPSAADRGSLPDRLPLPRVRKISPSMDSYA